MFADVLNDVLAKSIPTIPRLIRATGEAYRDQVALGRPGQPGVTYTELVQRVDDGAAQLREVGKWLDLVVKGGAAIAGVLHLWAIKLQRDQA